jgi:copper(I)-binding protein
VRRTTQILLAVGVLNALFLSGCGGDDDGATAADAAMAMETVDRGTAVAEVGHLAIYAPYVPAPPADIAALYFVVVNEGDEPDRLIGISSAAAGMAMLHQSVTDGDTMRMTPVEGGLETPPAGEVVLAQGGYHVMLMSLVETLEVGDIVHATLEFEIAGTVMIEAPVIDAASGGMDNMASDDQ